MKPNRKPSERAMHKISPEQFRIAVVFHKTHGFWNPAMTPVSLACGMPKEDSGAITSNWRKVTCLRCLKKRASQRAGKRKAPRRE
jgi:hypothetical protein